MSQGTPVPPSLCSTPPLTMVTTLLPEAPGHRGIWNHGPDVAKASSKTHRPGVWLRAGAGRGQLGVRVPGLHSRALISPWDPKAQGWG